MESFRIFYPLDLAAITPFLVSPNSDLSAFTFLRNTRLSFVYEHLLYFDCTIRGLLEDAWMPQRLETPEVARRRSGMSRIEVFAG